MCRFCLDMGLKQSIGKPNRQHSTKRARKHPAMRRRPLFRDGHAKADQAHNSHDSSP